VDVSAGVPRTDRLPSNSSSAVKRVGGKLRGLSLFNDKPFVENDDAVSFESPRTAGAPASQTGPFLEGHEGLGGRRPGSQNKFPTNYIRVMRELITGRLKQLVENRRQIRSDRCQLRGLWIGLCIQLLMLLVVGGYAAVSYKQWRQMILQSNSLEASLLAARQMEDLMRQANARNQQLAEDALRVTRESNEASQRAWMLFRGVEPTRVSLAQQPTRLLI